MKDDLSQKIHGNMIFSVYMYKCYKCDITPPPPLPPCQKSKDNIVPKNTLKGDISGITKKDGIHPRKYGISVEIPY